MYMVYSIFLLLKCSDSSMWHIQNVSEMYLEHVYKYGSELIRISSLIWMLIQFPPAVVLLPPLCACLTCYTLVIEQ